jgi:hypothetical protein
MNFTPKTTGAPLDHGLATTAAREGHKKDHRDNPSHRPNLCHGRTAHKVAGGADFATRPHKDDGKQNHRVAPAPGKARGLR